MTTYAELSAEDQAVVDNLSNTVRSAAGEMARAMLRLKAIQEDTNGLAIFASIDAGETVPNRSGLAGADSMTRSEMGSMWGILETILDTYNTTGNRNVWTKACGINTMLDL